MNLKTWYGMAVLHVVGPRREHPSSAISHESSAVVDGRLLVVPCRQRASQSECVKILEQLSALLLPS